MLDVVRNSQPQVEEFYDEQILEQKRLYSQRYRDIDDKTTPPTPNHHPSLFSLLRSFSLKLRTRRSI